MNIFNKSRLKSRLYVVLIAIIIFVCMIIFYTEAHPLYIYDMDDWDYVISVRHALPSLTQWNPTKILPETLMPLVSWIGAYIIYPHSGDYIQALCYAFAFFTSLVIAVYTSIIAALIKKLYEISDNTLLVVMSLFMLSHFYPYLTQDANNAHVFYAGNVNCVFNYLIPALWNFILCCYFMMQEKRCWYDKDHYVQKGLIVLAVYLAINSNLWHSIILMSYFGIDLLVGLLRQAYNVKRKRNKNIWRFVSDFFKENFPKLLSLMVWFVSMIFEINGGRARWANSVSDKLHLKESVKAFADSICTMNVAFLMAVVAINLLALCIAGYHYKKSSEAQSFFYEQGKKLAVMIICMIYLVLLAAKVSANYIKNSNVMISWMLWLLLITLSSIVYIIKTEPRFSLILPLITYILVFEVVITKKTFAQNYASAHAPAVIKALDNDIIEQVKAAENAGESTVTVYFPITESGDWPRKPSAMGNRIANALYYHGVTEHHMEIEIITDESKDIQFHLNRYK